MKTCLAADQSPLELSLEQAAESWFFGRTIVCRGCEELVIRNQPIRSEVADRYSRLRLVLGQGYKRKVVKM